MAFATATPPGGASHGSPTIAGLIAAAGIAASPSTHWQERGASRAASPPPRGSADDGVRLDPVPSAIATVVGSSSNNHGNSPGAAAGPVPGPERPRCRRRLPFTWQPSVEYEQEFHVSGDQHEIVTKIGDFWEKDWVIPVGGSLRMIKGGFYRWAVCIDMAAPHRPQIQIGVHGEGHRRPWRLLTSSRCSRARDDDPWLDRPGGDRALKDGDILHVEVDLRGLHFPFGTFSLAINDEPPELIFDDIPLHVGTPIIPVVCMGGDQSRARLCPVY